MADSEPGKREAPTPSREARGEPIDEWHGSGLCEEAQADGVPCSEPGRICEHCEHARGDAASLPTA